jgi:hypothetical protein
MLRARAQPVEVCAEHSHTLWEPAELLRRHRAGKAGAHALPPTTYEVFLKLVAAAGPPAPALTAEQLAGRLPPFPAAVAGLKGGKGALLADPSFDVPSLEEMGYVHTHAPLSR